MLCVKCKQDLPETYFNFCARNTNRNQLQSYCKSCMKVFGRQHRKDNAEHYRQRNRKACESPRRRLQNLLSANTVDRSQLDFDWAWEKLVNSGFRCELTGLSFTWEARSPTALSIDRIDPALGYTKENIRFVCWWVNAAMGNWGFERLKQLIKDSNFD